MPLRQHFVTIYGESQDEIMFRYYDVENSEEYAFPSEEVVVFGVNSTLGSIKEPYELHFGMLGVEEMNTQEFTVYPNPATVSEEIYLGGVFLRWSRFITLWELRLRYM